MLAACAFVAVRATARLAPEAAGAPRALALMTTLTAALLLVHLVPGALGLFRPGWVLVAAALAAAAARRLPVPRAPRGSAERAGPLAALATFAIAACALGLLRTTAGAPLSSIDAQNFQVPIPARWIQEHSLWGLHQFIADYSNATYPHNGNLLIAAAMLPFHSTFLVRLVAVPFWALTGVAVSALARELGGRRDAAALAGAAFVALPVTLSAGLDGAQTDMPMLACLGAGVLFLAQRRLVLAGLALGIAFGTKWYALDTVAIVLALWALARWRAAGLGRTAREAALLVALIVLAGGFWLARNWVRTGDPFFPQPLHPLFDAPPDPLRAAGGWTIAHYLTDWDVWRTYLLPALKHSFGWAGALILLAGIAGAGARDRRARLVAAGGVLLAIAYVVTPYSAFGPEGHPVLAGASTRYALPALMAAAVLAGCARSPAVRIALAAAVVDGLVRGFSLTAGQTVVGAALAALAYGLWRAPRRPAAVAAAAAGLAAVLVAAHRANTQSYAPLDPTLAWIERHAPSGHRIGVAGLWSPEAVSPVLPAFGPRLGNRVAFVGRYRQGMLRAYPDAHGFQRALGAFDLLVAGTGIPPGSGGREAGWARAAGWRTVAQSPRLVLLASR